MRALAAPVVGLICAFHWKAWLLRCRCSWANGPNNMSAAHDGGTAEKRRTVPHFSPGKGGRSSWVRRCKGFRLRHRACGSAPGRTRIDSRPDRPAMRRRRQWRPGERQTCGQAVHESANFRGSRERANPSLTGLRAELSCDFPPLYTPVDNAVDNKGAHAESLVPPGIAPTYAVRSARRRFAPGRRSVWPRRWSGGARGQARRGLRGKRRFSIHTTRDFAVDMCI